MQQLKDFCNVHWTQHFEWAMKDEKSLETNTAWLNYWISNLKLCQDTANILSVYLLRYCKSIINFTPSKSVYSTFSIQQTLNLFNDMSKFKIHYL